MDQTSIVSENSFSDSDSDILESSYIENKKPLSLNTTYMIRKKTENDILETSYIDNERSFIDIDNRTILKLAISRKQINQKGIYDFSNKDTVENNQIISSFINDCTNSPSSQSLENYDNAIDELIITSDDSVVSIDDKGLVVNSDSDNDSQYSNLLSNDGQHSNDISVKNNSQIQNIVKEINIPNSKSHIEASINERSWKKGTDPKVVVATHDAGECVGHQLSFMSSLSDKVFGFKCDPIAAFFKLHFRRTKSSLARHLYYIFNNVVFNNQLPIDMPLKWSNRLVTSSGITVYDTETHGVYIVLSKKIITTTERLRDTLVHEMCHAAVWIINQSRDCHGPIWKLWALKARCLIPELPKISRCHTYEIIHKYLYKCEDCGYCIGRSRPSEKLLTTCICGYCGGHFKLKENDKQAENDNDD